MNGKNATAASRGRPLVPARIQGNHRGLPLRAMAWAKENALILAPFYCETINARVWDSLLNVRMYF